jgi:hypothetical protein
MSSPHFTPPTETPPRGAAPASPATLELGGRDVVVAYSDVAAEFAALRTSAIVVDRSFRGRMRFFGENPAALTGLVTATSSLPPGRLHAARSRRRTYRRRPADLRQRRCRTASTLHRARGPDFWRW